MSALHQYLVFFNKYLCSTGTYLPAWLVWFQPNDFRGPNFFMYHYIKGLMVITIYVLMLILRFAICIAKIGTAMFCWFWSKPWSKNFSCSTQKAIHNCCITSYMSFLVCPNHFKFDGYNLSSSMGKRGSMGFQR